MIRMWVRRVMMIVIVIVVMPVFMIVVVITCHQPAQTGAKGVTQCAIFNIRTRRIGALSLDMVMMAFLNGAYFCLKTQHLCAVFTHRAIGRRHFADLFGDPLRKGLQHRWVIAQISCLNKVDVGVCGGHLIGKAIDPVNKDARKQEIRKHDDPLVG